METREAGWTQVDLRRLLGRIKTSIPASKKDWGYSRTQKFLDWKKITFSQYSPEECQAKWKQMFQKMRKQRTLTDLLEEAEGAISDPFRPKKQQIHPELPKRPPLAHTLYLKEHLELYKKQHPDLEHKQLIARLSACYKKLPARVKVKYVKKYNLSRDQYDKEMIRLRRQYGKPFQPMSNTGHYSALKRKLEEQDDLDAETSPTSSGPSRKRGIVELPNQPPVNGFQLLVAEQRVASGPMAPRDHLRASSLRWRSLRQAERDGYNTRANGLKQRYGATLNAFLSNLTKEQKEILKEDLEMLFRTAKKYSKIKPLLFDGEPKKPSCAGASVFCSQKMRCLIGDFRDHREKFSWINSKWKTLSTEQKAPFCKEAETRFHRYTLDLQDWFRNLSPETKAEYLNQKPRNMEYVTLDLEKPVKKERHMASDSEDEEYLDCPTDIPPEANEEEDQEDEEALWTHEKFAKSACLPVEFSNGSGSDSD
ncbi:nucleolar transcription factor 1 isoform X3 [Gadus morhua]|uniref:Nucleolar transcription factor 1-like n=1 Tax=Gadus morhua TaxID=8049 RepID=A0A8C5BY02_GADMO|nr:nucleolar transcription factor 1-like isoform X3 [Gadus morhua]